MKKIKMKVYSQNNSGGRSHDMKHTFSPDLTTIPVRHMLKRGYYDIAVTKDEYLPEDVYFNGVRDKLDCACCGDRWHVDRTYNNEDVYIFETLKEFNQEIGNLDEYVYYTILEDLNKLEKDEEEI